MNNMNLSQLTQQITKDFESQLSIVVPTENLSLTNDGFLYTGKNEFPLALEASEQFAGLLGIPTKFYLTLESDLRPIFFNRRLSTKRAGGDIGRDLRLTLNRERHVIGFDDPKLLKINPLPLMEAVNSSLPKDLLAEQIEVSRFHSTSNLLSFSCYSPQIESQPRVGDIINGGIDVHHSISGEFGTQIRCYLRRQICSNGACTHICQDEKSLRARRLLNGKYDDKDMIEQIRCLLIKAWTQLDEKLTAIKGLLNKPRVSIDFLRHQRTRFSLNNRVLHSLENAVNQDEFGSTDTQYDLFNAITRIATHDDSLSLRQQRRLMSMAGEFSQQDIHQCSQCGSWLTHLN
jgi:hypothetical protein